MKIVCVKLKSDFREVYLLLSIPSCSIDSTDKRPLTINMIRLRHWQSFPEDDSAMLNVSSSDAKLQLLSCMYNVHILITYVSCLYLSNEKTSRATSHHPIIFESPSIDVTLHLQNKGSYIHCGILSGSG